MNFWKMVGLINMISGVRIMVEAGIKDSGWLAFVGAVFIALAWWILDETKADKT